TTSSVLATDGARMHTDGERQAVSFRRSLATEESGLDVDRLSLSTQTWEPDSSVASDLQNDTSSGSLSVSIRPYRRLRLTSSSSCLRVFVVNHPGGKSRRRPLGLRVAGHEVRQRVDHVLL